ncbi:uncharacterized protein LOC106408120 [Brassica napus]|uniref:uncharacterized protein LOC106408120 n=1 Tax=Brassica napus TaxID=3708 RepID=UPI00207AEF60|nr:uncharacterized protein LOC106408120 [Brassica napus]
MGLNIKQNRYDKTKIAFVCVGKGCSWRIYCSSSEKYPNKWQVKILKKDHTCVHHTCVPMGTCEMLNVPQIAHLFVDKIREEPEYFMPMKIEQLVMEKWKISVSKPQCQHARNKALRWIEREYDEQFGRLRDYCSEIRSSNVNSSVELDCLKNDDGIDVFNRFYVCFDILRRNWKETCRPLIGVDGLFLKSRMKGQLLMALGRDGNNAIYCIAWVVVQVENKVNLLWFVEKIKVDLGLDEGDGYVMVSDSQKGLIAVVKRELPRIERRMCVRHIYGKLKKNHGKKPEMKKLIWNLAWSYNDADYKENLLEIERYDQDVYDDVLKTKPEKWCREFHKLGPYCEDVENNSTESFNNSKARDKPFVPMLETIACLAMVRIAKRDVICTSHKGIRTPYVTEMLKTLHEKASLCTVRPSINQTFGATTNGCQHRVSLENRTCSCRRWEITGIPCEHAYGVMLSKGLKAQDYVVHWFQTSTWKRTYAVGIVPLRGANFWPVGPEPSIIEPEISDQPGCKKVTKADKKRKRGVNESPSKKEKFLKRIMHCGICGAPNHNSRFHKKNPKKPFVSGESSQPEASQGVSTQPTQLEK